MICIVIINRYYDMYCYYRVGFFALVCCFSEIPKATSTDFGFIYLANV